MSEYQGQAFKDNIEPVDVPRAPAREGLAPGGTGTYGQVTIIGSYGLACSQHQTLSWQNITLAQARELKWQYYGVCSAKMTCYDNQGNVVYEE